ncbi:DUF6364 family protein [Mucilaginibacter sp. HD30]
MKLTLNIQPGLIEKMKQVAKKRNTSISKLAEQFFEKEIEIEKEPFRMKTEDEISDLIKGLVAVTEPVADFDHKMEYGKHLEDKYGK